MNRSVETTGTTVEEATQEAARLLGVETGDLIVEVLEEPRKKVWGIVGGQETYRIRAEVAAEEPPADGEPAAEAESASEEAESDAAEHAAGAAHEVITRILDLMGVDAEATVTAVEPEQVTIELEGRDAGDLIGHHGATLDALQLIVAIVANRDTAEPVRVMLDAEGYRDRRIKMLESMALSHAQKVIEAGQELVVEDLKPYERRIVHMVLKDHPEVQTYSEGEGHSRRLVISPRT